MQQLALNVIEHSTQNSGALQNCANLWLLSNLVGTTLFSNDPAWAWWANIFYFSHAWGVLGHCLPRDSGKWCHCCLATPLQAWCSQFPYTFNKVTLCHMGLSQNSLKLPNCGYCLCVYVHSILIHSSLAKNIWLVVILIYNYVIHIQLNIFHI